MDFLIVRDRLCWKHQFPGFGDVAVTMFPIGNQSD
jgi:hypothetical protein